MSPTTPIPHPTAPIQHPYLYNLHDDELLDGIALPSPSYNLFSLQTMHDSDRPHSPSTASTNSNVLPQYRATATQDLAEFLRTSGPHDYRKSSCSDNPRLLDTYRRGIHLLRSRSKPEFTSAHLPNNILPRTTSRGKPYLQIHVDYTPLDRQTSLPSSPSSVTPSLISARPSSAEDHLSPAPWTPTFPQFQHPVLLDAFAPRQLRTRSMEVVGLKKTRSFSMGAVGGSIPPANPLHTPPPRRPRKRDSTITTSSDVSTAASSPTRRRRTPPRPGPPPVRSLPALPETTPPVEPTLQQRRELREQKVREMKTRDLKRADLMKTTESTNGGKENLSAVSDSPMEPETKKEHGKAREMVEMEKRLAALERKNEILEKALIAVIRGSILGDAWGESGRGEGERGQGLEAFLKEIVKTV